MFFGFWFCFCMVFGFLCCCCCCFVLVAFYLRLTVPLKQKNSGMEVEVQTKLMLDGYNNRMRHVLVKLNDLMTVDEIIEAAKVWEEIVDENESKSDYYRNNGTIDFDNYDCCLSTVYGPMKDVNLSLCEYGFSATEFDNYQTNRKLPRLEIRLTRKPYLHSFQVFCKILRGETITLNVSSGLESVLTLKRKIEVSEGIPPQQQWLSFGRYYLEDNRTLHDYGIMNESSLWLRTRLRGT